ncbi:AI-2E family transporter [Halomonas alkaliantarctica]|nr:AI-2E family transporter [Halomonas alkaliantarctica]
MQLSHNRSPLRDFSRKVWIVVAITFSALTLMWLVWVGLEIILLGMVGLLLALFLYLPANFISRHSFLTYRWALVAVLIIISGLIALFTINFSSNITEQSEQLAEILPNSLNSLQSRMQEWPMGHQLLIPMVEGESLRDAFANFISEAGSVFSTTFGALVNTVVVFFVGLYVAFEPWTYRNGIVLLFIPKRRIAASDLLKTIMQTMSWWLLSRGVSMIALGVITGLGLWLIDIPLAFSLGLIAAVLAFVPYLGPMISAVPALLVAFTIGYVELLYVAMLYLLVQFLESYLITPYVQRKAVRTPPALLIMVQLLLSLLAGVVGLLLAGPLTAVLLVLVKRIYINGWLKEQQVSQIGTH